LALKVDWLPRPAQLVGRLYRRLENHQIRRVECEFRLGGTEGLDTIPAYMLSAASKKSRLKNFRAISYASSMLANVTMPPVIAASGGKKPHQRHFKKQRRRALHDINKFKHLQLPGTAAMGLAGIVVWGADYSQGSVRRAAGSKGTWRVTGHGPRLSDRPGL